MNFAVRAAGPRDAGRLAHLHVSTWRETYAHLLPEDFFSSDHLRMRLTMWTHILEHPRDDQTVRVAEIHGRAVGLALAGPSEAIDGLGAPRERQLFSLYVSQDEHGTGVGQALLDEVLGSDPAVLWASQQSPRAVAFYRRNGFELDGAEQIDRSTPSLVGARMVR